MTLSTILAVGSGGFIGAVMRVYLNGLFSKAISWHYIPVGTLGVNLLGSLIMGMLFAFFSHTQFFSPNMKSFLATGILGALTTYSTFALENFIMIQHGNYLHALLNMTANLVGTLLAVTVGYFVISVWLR